MRILLLTHTFNSLAQRLCVELTERGHRVSVELDINDAVTAEAVELFDPQVLLAPFLKRPIPERLWRTRPCLIVHPGIPGDRGPSALDWALLEGRRAWGVTVLEAEARMDAGPVWASEPCVLREDTKSSNYRRQIADAAVTAVLEALERMESRTYSPRRVDPEDPGVLGRERPICRAGDRRIDWAHDDTETVLRKIRSADGFPGIIDELFGRRVRLFDAHPAALSGPAGNVLARCGDALARATRDGAVWIGHVREEGLRTDPQRPGLKLPAAQVFRPESASLPEADGYQPIRYEEDGSVGFLHFGFYNGAMSTQQCEALRAAYARSLRRPTRVLVLTGGADYWSTGIHLGAIEAAESPADESWRNINAIDDLTREIILTTDRLVVAALRGGAGAGGVFLALAADEVWASPGVVLNPHYKDMGNLFGSEYWTYLLPRRVGEAEAARLMGRRLPMGIAEARRVGLVDRMVEDGSGSTLAAIGTMARSLAGDPAFESRIAQKRLRREMDERAKPLETYRCEELARMQRNFYGFDPSYHVARYNFIYKVPKSRTPLHLARHRAARAREPVALRTLEGGAGVEAHHRESAHV